MPSDCSLRIEEVVWWRGSISLWIVQVRGGGVGSVVSALCQRAAMQRPWACASDGATRWGPSDPTWSQTCWWYHRPTPATPAFALCCGKQRSNSPKCGSWCRHRKTGWGNFFTSIESRGQYPPWSTVCTLPAFSTSAMYPTAFLHNGIRYSTGTRTSTSTSTSTGSHFDWGFNIHSRESRCSRSSHCSRCTAAILLLKVAEAQAQCSPAYCARCTVFRGAFFPLIFAVPWSLYRALKCSMIYRYSFSIARFSSQPSITQLLANKDYFWCTCSRSLKQVGDLVILH
jgi:hypothetical protein